MSSRGHGGRFRTGVMAAVALVTVALPAAGAAHAAPADAAAVGPGGIKAPAPGGQRPLLVPPSSGPIPARPNDALYRLRKTIDGGYVLDDLRFRAVVAPDGHVTFQDNHLRAVPHVLGFPLRLGQGDPDERPSLMRVLQRTLRGDRNRLPPSMSREGFAVADPSGIWDPALRLPALGRTPMAPAIVSVGGGFDLTDELMSRAGQGFYRYEKAKFLSATFEFRMKMAVEWHGSLLKRSLAELPARLDALWADPAFAPREKRGIVCGVWTEIDTDEPESRAAAAAIVGWIRRTLPAGGPDAYGYTELAACTTAGGRAFEPYRTP